MKKTLAILLAYVMVALPMLGQNSPAVPASNLAQLLNNAQSYGQGEYAAISYNYATNVYSGGGSANTTYTIQPLQSFVVIPGSRSVAVFAANAPITIGQGAVQETVTPSSVTAGCYQWNAPPRSCTITAAFTYAHGKGEAIYSGSAGLQEAINDANSHGGGIVEVDPLWFNATPTAGTKALIAAATPFQNVSIADYSNGVPQFWNIQPGTTVLAAPVALTSTTWTQTASPAGSASWGSTTYACVAYVDINGQEGPCGPTGNITTTTLYSQNITAPAASTGAVGYTAYISLSGGTYALAYKIPLSGLCTLTTLETTIQACALKNTTYGQVASNIVGYTGYPVNTSRIWIGTGGTSSTSDYVGNSAARTTYAYTPSNHIGTPGINAANAAFHSATAPASTVPAVVGTVTLPAGFMNYVGSEIQVCAYWTEASAGSTATVSTLQFLWDADGQNTAGAGVILGGPTVTATLVTSNADQWYGCTDLKTTVSGASTTAGSMLAGGGFLTTSYGAATTVSAASGPTIGAAAVASLNLAGEARLDVVYLHTTGTDGAAPTLTDLTVTRIN